MTLDCILLIDDTQVTWRKGSIDDDRFLEELMPQATAVVHTPGILLESDYKGSLSALAGGLLDGLTENLAIDQDRSNPLRNNSKHRGEGKYERINRDSALKVAKSYVESRPDTIAQIGPAKGNPFVYVSAEDVFRPFIPSRYITTKREAEAGISSLANAAETIFSGQFRENPRTSELQRRIRPIFVRPGQHCCIPKRGSRADLSTLGLMYHPDVRPEATLGAIPLQIIAAIQEQLPTPLRLQSFSKLLQPDVSPLSPEYQDGKEAASPADLPSPIESFANLLSVPPLNVDTVGEAICDAIADDKVHGILSVKDMLRKESEYARPSSSVRQDFATAV